MNSYETKETLNQTRVNTALTWEQILSNWQIITQALMSAKLIYLRRKDLVLCGM